MEESIKKFLEFNGKSIYFLAKDGQYWIALKPICDALNVNWKHQHERIKEDDTLGPASGVHRMQVDEKQSREYACLPEFYVYGWLMQINSDSPELKQYKWKCYEVLYNYFHGTIAKRISTLTAKSADREELQKLEREFAESETGVRIAALRKRINGHGRDLRELDVELSTNQMSLFN